MLAWKIRELSTVILYLSHQYNQMPPIIIDKEVIPQLQWDKQL